MWYINQLFLAFDTETKAEMLIRKGFFDDFFYVIYDNQEIAKFETWKEAQKFIEDKVKKLNSEKKQNVGN